MRRLCAVWKPCVGTQTSGGQFLNGIFDDWRKEDTHTVSMRNFDAVLSIMVYRAPR
jgi:sulfatase maturation enzyme AslB (radical SAM superfamily)